MKRRKRWIIRDLDYVTFWNQKGEYGKERVFRMRNRKRKRFEAWYQRRQRRGWFYDKGRGCMRQVCDYQPLGSMGITYCDYPCNGDC
jgi:hypothetical protein